MTFAMPCRDCNARENIEVANRNAVAPKAASMGWLLVDLGKTKYFLCPVHKLQEEEKA